MKTLDITVDLETCSLCPTAAVMSIGAVAWDRNGEDTPFIDEEFYQHVNIASAFLDGFTFDQDTANWWKGQSAEAKAALLADDETPLRTLEATMRNFSQWVKDLKEENGYDTVNLWCQGSDFDIAILRNICYKYKFEIPVKYTNFRDHRTFFMESARLICDITGTEFRQKDAYKMVEDYDGEGAPHDPVFDCKRSIYSTWQMMQKMRTIMTKKE